jgi:probable F420-dependent oxidoreductase
VRIETILPLGKVDPGLREPDKPLDIHQVATSARLVELLGYDGLMIEEIKDDPYVILAIAAQATERVSLGTAVAIAFPRSPTVTALSAWTLQKLCRGRLILGLGSQVKGHIERRYGQKWFPPGPWMREYVEALREIWFAWQEGRQPHWVGDRYRITLNVPLFDPGPIEHPTIPIHLAAVNSYMCEVSGEVADGIRPHPVCTPEYIENVMWPAVRKGAARRGRDLTEFSLSMKPLVATAEDEEQLIPKIRDARARIAFYASTPAYRAAFAFHGLGELSDEMKYLSKAQKWEEMPSLITDEVLRKFVSIGTYDSIAKELIARYGGLVTNLEFSTQVRSEQEKDNLRKMLTELKNA